MGPEKWITQPRFGIGETRPIIREEKGRAARMTRIMVAIEGGNVQGVLSDSVDVEVLIKDYDVDGIDEDNVYDADHNAFHPAIWKGFDGREAGIVAANFRLVEDALADKKREEVADKLQAFAQAVLDQAMQAAEETFRAREGERRRLNEVAVSDYNKAMFEAHEEYKKAVALIKK